MISWKYFAVTDVVLTKDTKRKAIYLWGIFVLWKYQITLSIVPGKIRYQFHDRSVTGQSQRAQWHIKSISTGVAGYIWVLLGVGGSPCIILIRTYWFGLSKGSGQRWQQMGDGRADNDIKWSYCRPRGKHAKENENNSLESGSGLLRPLLTLIAPILAFVIFIRM